MTAPTSPEPSAAPRLGCITHMDFPVEACLDAPRTSALAVLTGTEGPAYRPAGAAMVIRNGRVVAGSLSSGCVEQDIALQATACLGAGRPRHLRYGAGSPYFDVRLPCGGALDVAIYPALPPETAAHLVAARRARAEVRLVFTRDRIALDDGTAEAPLLRLRIVPDIAFHVFGKGPEAVWFAELAAAAGYATELSAPDAETLDGVRNPAVGRRRLVRAEDLSDRRFDRWSAVVLFFHDHDWEPRILAAAAASEVFYIGAQGGRRTRRVRDKELARLGVPPDRIAAMKGPAGLFSGARDPRTLAISVLSEVVAEAEHLREDDPAPRSRAPRRERAST